jgi:hypothetical protein
MHWENAVHMILSFFFFFFFLNTFVSKNWKVLTNQIYVAYFILFLDFLCFLDQERHAT